MNVSLDIYDNKARLKVDGSVSGEDVVALKNRLHEVLDSGADVLEMDLSDCKSICSSGIGKILYFYKDFQEKDGQFQITKSSPNIYDLLTTIKLNQLFPIHI